MIKLMNHENQFSMMKNCKIFTENFSEYLNIFQILELNKIKINIF